MTDLELLERAARAIGGEYRKHSLGGMYLAFPPNWNGSTWDPLTDDGDALRLAVRLNLAISIEDGQSWAHHEQVIAGSPVQHDGRDPYSATRRAIVRAAAEIGKAM